MAQATPPARQAEIPHARGRSLDAFGVPGAAINPFSRPPRRAAASTTPSPAMSRAPPTWPRATPAPAGQHRRSHRHSGPAGTDMITGLYSAIGDRPDPVHHGPGAHPRDPQEDFQAVDIASIAKRSRWRSPCWRPRRSPALFRSRRSTWMRSGRPGPVLIDPPIDVQLTEIEFDPETYEPLLVATPAATRAQIEKAISFLLESERPVIVAGGGIIGADACDLLVEFAELTQTPVVPTLMGWGALPDDHELNAGMVGADLAPLRQRQLPGVRLRPRHRQPLGRPPHWLQAGRLPPGRSSCTWTSSPRRSARSSRRTTGSSPDAKAALELFVEVAGNLKAAGRFLGPLRLGRLHPGAQGHAAAPDALRQRADEAAARVLRR